MKWPEDISRADTGTLAKLRAEVVEQADLARREIAVLIARRLTRNIPRQEYCREWLRLMTLKAECKLRVRILEDEAARRYW